MVLQSKIPASVRGEIVKAASMVAKGNITSGRITKNLDLMKPGDIIGFSGNSLLSAAINLATYGLPFWGISHVGIIGNQGFRKVLFESTMQSDLRCLVQGRVTSGVQAHSIPAAIEEYDGKVWYYPLVRELTEVRRALMNSFLMEHIGTNYDAVGAFRSAGRGFSWIESMFRDEDLSSLFCSEYCAAAHFRAGIQAGSASKWNPNKFVRHERRRGILGHPWRIK